MNSLIALVLIFGSYNAPIQPHIEGDVFTGNQLPYWGQVCTEAEVFGDPYGLNEAGYTVAVGTTVTLRELYGTWVMIRPAKWIPLAAVCPWGDIR